MKLNSDFLLRRVVDSVVLTPFGKKLARFNGMMTLNKVGAFIAEQLLEERTLDELVDAVVERFDVDRETAARDAAAFIEELRANGALDE